MSEKSKGYRSVMGGSKKVNKPVVNIPAPKEEPIEDTHKEIEVKTEVKHDPIEEKKEEIPVSLDVEYFEELEKKKPRYITHKQITVRIHNKTDAELNRITKGIKGLKQELINRAIEREVALIQNAKNKRKMKS